MRNWPLLCTIVRFGRKGCWYSTKFSNFLNSMWRMISCRKSSTEPSSLNRIWASTWAPIGRPNTSPERKSATTSSIWNRSSARTQTCWSRTFTTCTWACSPEGKFCKNDETLPASLTHLPLLGSRIGVRR
uniref:(northern house mosquito) hypothetical protein n=1 Tax=Culex pipiens TaxID=7175 RepID=A0A8D8F0Z7_CULPI